MITELDQVKKILDKLDFDDVDRNFLKDIAGDSPLFVPALLGLASLKISNSIANYTKLLTIVTAILAIVAFLQVVCIVIQLFKC